MDKEINGLNGELCGVLGKAHATLNVNEASTAKFSFKKHLLSLGGAQT